MNPNEQIEPLTPEQRAEFSRVADEHRQKYRNDMLRTAARVIHVSRSWSKIFKFRHIDGGIKLIKCRAVLNLQTGLTVHEETTCREMMRFSLAEVSAALQALPQLGASAQ